MQVLAHSYCPGCGENIGGKTCVCKECYFFVHRSCADKWKQQMEHPFHSLHPLNLYYRSTDEEYIQKYTCSACQKITRCLAYHCPECSFGLCLECVSMDPTIRMEDGYHILHLYKNTTFHRHCSACNEKDRHTFFIICMVPKCGYAVHLHCTPLSFPKTVKHLYHHHELFLTKSEVEGDEREDNSRFDESRDHLFFSCSNTKMIWERVSSSLLLHRRAGDWHSELDYAMTTWKGNRVEAFIYKLAWTIYIYIVWKERNTHIFQNSFTSESACYGSILYMLRSRLASLPEVSSRICSSDLSIAIALKDLI